MILAGLHSVDKFYGDQVVLERATMELRPTNRTALIGRNGAGKTTILRLLAGLEQPDGGEAFRRSDCEIAVLEQDPSFPAGTSLDQVAERAFEPLQRLERQLAALEKAGLQDPQRYHAWEQLHETFERRGGYQRRSRRESVFAALGFRGREGDPVESLSGGERTRLGLARLLMAQPDVLLLDEPTNHLDIEMRDWLSSFLARYPGAVLMVSHDRDFLDDSADSTLEVSRGKLRSHPGNPSSYRRARQQQLEQEAALRAAQAKEHARLTAAAERMKRWARQNEKLHRRAKAMERRLERFAAEMIAPPEAPEASSRFRFEADRSGEVVLQASHLSKGFGQVLFQGVSFTLRRGDRVALVGPNGAGKSSLLRILLGELGSDDARAELRFGARVRVGYYDQQLRGVSPENTLVEELLRLTGEREAHNLLGRFQFPFDAQFKKVADLSGGERARLALLKLIMGRFNFLVLDEPTNHLDVEMIEALEGALGDYPETLLFVSHDRRFIANVASTIWDLRDGRLTQYPGDWDYYRRKRSLLEQGAAEDPGEPGAPQAPPGSGGRPRDARPPSKWRLERTLEELQEEIAALERDLAGIASQLASPGALEAAEIQELGERHAELEAALLESMARWEEAATALEER